MCEIQKRNYEIVAFGMERNYGKHVFCMDIMLRVNGKEVYDLLKEIHEVFLAECCIPCSKCHELQGKVEAILEKCRERD